MMDFSGSAGAASSFDLIPEGQLAFAILNVRGTKSSKSGGAYLDCELTIDAGQPFAGRKVFDMIGDPNHAGNSEGYRQMGMIAITRILETGRGAGPNNTAGYQIAGYEALNGLRVAVKIGIERGTGGHDDKNRVKEYLTPNPASQSGHKGYAALTAGQFNANPAPAAQAPASGFGGTAAPHGVANAGFGAGGAGFGSTAASGGFGSAGGTQPAAAGFQQAGQQPANAQTAESQQNQGTAFASNAMGTFPSNTDPAAAPGWLSQANGTSG